MPKKTLSYSSGVIQRSAQPSSIWVCIVVGVSFGLSCLTCASPAELVAQQAAAVTTQRKPIALSPPGEMEDVTSQMAKLRLLTGDWKGSGWMELPTTGGRVTFPQTKNVRLRLQGRMLEIEGLSDTLNPGFDCATLVFVVYDRGKKEYRIRAYSGPGRMADGYGLMTDNVFEWGYTFGQFSVRYRIRIDSSGRWVETGESSLDSGATWQLFSELLLEKSK